MEDNKEQIDSYVAEFVRSVQGVEGFTPLGQPWPSETNYIINSVISGLVPEALRANVRRVESLAFKFAGWPASHHGWNIHRSFVSYFVRLDTTGMPNLTIELQLFGDGGVTVEMKYGKGSCRAEYSISEDSLDSAELAFRDELKATIEAFNLLAD